LEVLIDKEFITLAQLLKMADLISTGGEAKYFLQENAVRVNGLQDQRRGRKLYPDDVIKIAHESYRIRVR